MNFREYYKLTEEPWLNKIDGESAFDWQLEEYTARNTNDPDIKARKLHAFVSKLRSVFAGERNDDKHGGWIEMKPEEKEWYIANHLFHEQMLLFLQGNYAKVVGIREERMPLSKRTPEEIQKMKDYLLKAAGLN